MYFLVQCFALSSSKGDHHTSQNCSHVIILIICLLCFKFPCAFSSPCGACLFANCLLGGASTPGHSIPLREADPSHHIQSGYPRLCCSCGGGCGSRHHHCVNWSFICIPCGGYLVSPRTLPSGLGPCRSPLCPPPPRNTRGCDNLSHTPHHPCGYSSGGPWSLHKPSPLAKDCQGHPLQASFKWNHRVALPGGTGNAHRKVKATLPKLPSNRGALLLGGPRLGEP